MRRVWKFPVAPYQQVQVLEVQGSDPVPVALAKDARGMLCNEGGFVWRLYREKKQGG